MNDETFMVHWRRIEPILKIRPLIKIGELHKELGGRKAISRSYLNDVLNYAEEKKELITRHSGGWINFTKSLQLQPRERVNWLVQLRRDMREARDQKLERIDNDIRGLLHSIYHNVPQSYLDANGFRDVEELIQWFMNELPAIQEKTQK